MRGFRHPLEDMFDSMPKASDKILSQPLVYKCTETPMPDRNDNLKEELDRRLRTKRVGAEGDCLNGSEEDFMHDAYEAHNLLAANRAKDEEIAEWQREAKRQEARAEDFNGNCMNLESQLATVTQERDKLKAAILDIDAHATGYGILNPDDPEGSPAAYLISVGCLHRALGLVGHCAAKAESSEREPFTKEMIQECLRRGAVGANELLKQLEEDRRRGAWKNGKRML